MKTITGNNLIAVINEEGAYLEKLTFGDKPVFFDKTEITRDGKTKVRGGMHTCAPNFSDDKTLNELPTHGFGRDLTWQVLEEGEDKLSLGLKGVGSYENVSFRIDYKIEDDRLNTKLTIENEAGEEKLVAPAFHPYFYTNYDELSVEGFEIDKDELPNSIFIETTDLSFKTADFAIDIVGRENVGLYTIWTDFWDNYLCLEPTYNGRAFADENLEAYKLKTDESFIQDFDIVIKKL